MAGQQTQVQPAEVIPNAQSINESVAPVRGIIAACGPAAAYMAASAVNAFRATTAGLQSLVSKGLNAGTLDTGGQGPYGPQWDLAQYGIDSTVSFPNSAIALEQTLDNALAQNKPIVLGLAEAHNLTSEPPGLHGHFVTVVGRDTAGRYVTGDPNTYAATQDDFTRNSLGQLFDSAPFSVTVPKLGAQGTLGIPNLAFSNPLNPTDWEGAIQQGLSSGIQGAFQNIQSDLGKQFGGWAHFFTRFVVFFVGTGILIISFDKFLGSFDFSGVTGKPGPIEGTIAKIIRSEQQKGEELAGIAKQAAVIP